MGSIPLGKLNGKTVWASKETREQHFHIMGNSRMGKSFFMEHMIRQDIMSGAGVCVIDPHGTMYDNLVQWLAVSGAANHRQVHLINPAEDGWSVGFNPFCAGDADPSVRVDMMVDACAKVWGGSDMTQTPRLSKCLSLVFYALAAHNLSIADARRFTTAPFQPDRFALTSTLNNWDREQDWRDMNSYSPRQFSEYMESTNSRLLPFSANQRVMRLMGQTSNLLDFKQCMDNDHIVLVNLAGKGKISEQNAQVIGALLFADLFFCAKQRDLATADRHPFYCYVDECADYITEHVAKSLDQTAKFGLHLILAHHRMSQLEQYGEGFREAVMAGAQNKVIFRLDIDDAAEEMARHLFRREFDIERRKENLTVPVAVGQEIIELTGSSEGTSSAQMRGGGDVRGGASMSGRAEAQSGAKARGHSDSEAEGYYEPNDPFALLPDQPDGKQVTEGSSDNTIETDSWSITSNSAETDNWSSTSSWTETDSTTSTISRSESLRTIFEERGVPMTLEEIIHEATAKVRTLPKRQMLVYLAGAQTTVSMRSPDLAPARALPSMIERKVDRFVERSMFSAWDHQIKPALEARKRPALDIIDHEDHDDDGDAFSYPIDR